MFCKSCGQNVADDSTFCKQCGLEFPREVKYDFVTNTPDFCPKCGGKSGGAAYCAACGAALTGFTVGSAGAVGDSARAKAPAAATAVMPDLSKVQAQVQAKVKSSLPKLGLGVDDILTKPVHSVAIFAAVGLILALIATLIVNGMMGEAGDEGNVVALVLGYGDSLFSTFLRAMGSGFTMMFGIETYYDDYTLAIGMAIGSAILLFIPILAAFAARRFGRRDTEKNALVAAVINSLWMGVVGILVAIVASIFKKSLDDSSITFIRHTYSIFTAFGFTFITTLFAQLVLEYRPGRSHGQDLGDGGSIADGITAGLMPVKTLAPMMAVVTVAGLVALFAKYGDTVGDVMDEFAFSGIIAILTLACDLVVKLICLAFGMPLSATLAIPDNKLDTGMSLSIFGAVADKTSEALPLVTLGALVVLAALAIAQFHTLREKREGTGYWISGGVALGVHTVLVSLLARFATLSVYFKPDRTLAGELGMSTKANTFLLGMSGVLWVVLIPAIAFVVMGLLVKRGSQLESVMATITQRRVVLAIAGVAVMVLGFYVHRETILEVGESLIGSLDILSWFL